MDLPIELKQKIEEEISKIDIKRLQSDAQNISTRYRDKKTNKVNNQLIKSDEEAISYAASRMPATYGAIYSALKNIVEVIELQQNEIEQISIQSLLDVGAGTGAASWASNKILELENIICIENEKYMMNVGKMLMQAGEESLRNAIWIKKNITTDKIEEKADLVIASYVLNEIKEENIEEILEKLWNATNKILLIVEPGTPEGYKEISKIRQYYINKGAYIVAPCTHNYECKIPEGDWCSFVCRVARTKTHKYLKNGDVPYEDEKFSYIAFSKSKITKPKSRILRHPKIENGKITLKVCKENGNIEECVITKKDKELFKHVKKLNASDIV